MSLYSIRIIHVWVAISASIRNVFGGLSVEYKWLSSNCTSLDVHASTLAPSIGMCAALCTQTSDCNGFAWKENGCNMLKTCPRCCKSNSDIDTEWSLYCPDGKIIIRYCKRSFIREQFIFAIFTCIILSRI